ncbi:aminopeptidase N [Rhizomonospora bruguierae]|uniref:aminopeptidase N n=1 Tax=Rhizomonospora bruguierae TaxID=1581705 RepID=UPI001BCBDA8E|nr:aminopeptidase N [Micromonospora sp. NBRC 107566]
MAGNLTRDEAAARAAALTVEGYDVELDLGLAEREDRWFGSTTRLRFRATPGTGTFIELTGARLRLVTLNGKPLDTSGYDPAVGRIVLPDLAAHNDVRVVADCAYSRSGEGLHRFVDPVDGGVYLYSQFATADAQRVYACFDQPDLKAPFTLMVSAPPGWSVASNTAAEPAGEPDRRVWRFPATPPLPTYATAVVAGPYHVVTDEYRDGDGTVIPLGLWCRASLAPYLDPDALLAITRGGFAFFTRAFGMPYPFGKYDQIFCPEFNLGAMENAGCVTVHEKYVFRSRVTDTLHERRAETLLHEMAHMWFGDLVTMRWWDDSWLNESFATWAGLLGQTETTRWTGAWTSFASMRKEIAYREDQLPSTHPVSADIPDVAAMEVNFDAITYMKGASVLKALAAWVGRDAFLAGVADYFRRHAWGNTTRDDLLEALARASGRDLSAWSREWLETAGLNTLRPAYDVDPAGRIAAFAVLQESAPPRSHRVAVGLYDHGPTGLVRRHRVEVDVTGARTEVPSLAGHARPDLVLVNDDDLTYAKVRPDARSLATLRSSIGDIVEPMPRALAWSAAWHLTRDGELPARDFLAMVLAGAGAIAEVTVAQSVLGQARTALYRYADPGWRESGLVALADGLVDLLLAAAPGGDRQLLYAQSLAQVARTGGQVALVRDLLSGARVLDGLVVDADLRWALLRRLVARGAAGAADIDAELARDGTADGEHNAAACRAAIPTAEAKAAAWERATSGCLTNFTLRATLDGFAERDHEALLAPYEEAFFTAVGGVWARWSVGMARRFTGGAYPDWAVRQVTLDRTDDLLAGDLPGPLRRLLLEHRDDVVRALHARSRDAAGTLVDPTR